jgi:glycosyltransferase involved in cell wall biosynthesis/GT2 family glycosyltransferase
MPSNTSRNTSRKKNRRRLPETQEVVTDISAQASDAKAEAEAAKTATSPSEKSSVDMTGSTYADRIAQASSVLPGEAQTSLATSPHHALNSIPTSDVFMHDSGTGSLSHATESRKLTAEEISELALGIRPAPASELAINEKTVEQPTPFYQNPTNRALLAQAFDEEYYRILYPDVAYDETTAIDHFLAIGCSEGRNPTFWFSTTGYLRIHPDVASGGQNPFLHYVQYGQFEQRTLAPALDADAWTILKDAFDVKFYRENNVGALSNAEDALAHYLNRGWKEGRDPAPWFSVYRYLDHHEDVLLSGYEPFTHYLRWGKQEARAIFPADPTYTEKIHREVATTETEFDAAFYARALESNGKRSALPLSFHYALGGWRTGRDPAPEFCTQAYLESYPDVASQGVNPFFHYVIAGRAEGRQPNHRVRNVLAEHFDAAYYLTCRPPLGGLDPLEHYIAFGWREGRDPSATFSTTHYLKLYPDVVEAGINPLLHYILDGQREGRSCFPLDIQRTTAAHGIPSILFVGHDGIRAGAQLVLLEIVRWYAERTRRPLKVLLLEPGPLAAEYVKYADLFVLTKSMHHAAGRNEGLRRFIGDKPCGIYVNTSAAARVWRIIDQIPALAAVPILFHVHELENVINEFQTDFDELNRRVPETIVVSEAVRRTLISKFGCREERITLSNAFIRPLVSHTREINDYRLAARRQLMLDADDFVIIGCGTADHRKGSDLFLSVAEQTLKRGAGQKYKFIWIGDGPNLELLRESIQKGNQTESIRFIGFRKDAQSLIAAADVFFLSSREDPFPLVCLEAAQFGVPTVHFSEGTGIGEFVQADAGVALPAFDTDAVSSAIVNLSSDGRKLEQLGMAARARLVSDYTTDRRLKEIAILANRAFSLRPAVSVIVPAFNHGLYLRERLRTVLNQTNQDFEVIILDDCSTDNTIDVASEFLGDPRVRLVSNKNNSGSGFVQWKRGFDIANSDLIWIAEGDDFCELSFLETLLPAFDNPRVTLAFCRTEIVNSNGQVQPGVLDKYLGTSDFDPTWPERHLSGRSAIEAGFGAICLIVNASSAIIRRNAVDEVMPEVATFRMCGDWLLYLAALKAGDMYYNNHTRNFFRRHAQSAVHQIEGSETYFRERHRISQFLVQNFRPTKRALQVSLAAILNEWQRFEYRNNDRTLDQFYSVDLLKSVIRNGSARKPLRVGFYVHGLLFSKGGIERVATEIANELAQRGHYVVLFCRDWGNARPVYQLSPDVIVEPAFDENDTASSRTRLRSSLASHGLDVFVPMLSEWLFEPIMDAALSLDLPVIASEHNDPWKIEELWWDRSARLRYFDRAAGIHFLVSKFISSVPLELRTKTTVIPNGVHLEADVLNAPIEGRPKRLISVGRLEPQKRFDRLIRAFSELRNQFPDWSLDIYGDGSEKIRLEELISELKLNAVVALRGVSDGIMREYVRASIFALPSAFEGFGIVILEAKMAGLPCIGYADCNGANELIRDTIDGLLVSTDEDGCSLAEGLASLMENEDVRLAMGQRGRLDVGKYAYSHVVDRWEQLIESIATAPVASCGQPGAAPEHENAEETLNVVEVDRLAQRRSEEGAGQTGSQRRDGPSSRRRGSRQPA